MKRFVEGEDRKQAVLLPKYPGDFVAGDNPGAGSRRLFVDELELHGLGFDGMAPAATGGAWHHACVRLN